jgi:hypothetical protein
MSACWDLSSSASFLQLQIQEKNQFFGIRRRIALRNCVLEHEKAALEAFRCHCKHFFHLKLKSCGDLSTEKVSNVTSIWSVFDSRTIAFHFPCNRENDNELSYEDSIH